MDTRLPLAFRIAVRDYWDADDSAVQRARKALEDTLGLPVRLVPEWPQLLQGLDKAYPDRDHLVRVVAGCVAVWYQVMQDLLDGAEDADEAQQQWLQTLLDHVKPVTSLQCYLEVSEAGAAWSDTRSSFLIQLPKQAIALPTELSAVFRGDILHCFDARRPLDRAGHSEDWADVSLDQTTGTATTTPADYMPSLDSLPRPDELFRRPPYYLTVNHLSQNDLEVVCSHSPSLQLLGEYLKRWARVNHNDVRAPPGVEISFQQSFFATGIYHDRLTLVAQKSNRSLYSVNPAMVLAFVESVLGYERIAIERGSWVFRRDVAFKE